MFTRAGERVPTCFKQTFTLIAHTRAVEQLTKRFGTCYYSLLFLKSKWRFRFKLQTT